MYSVFEFRLAVKKDQKDAFEFHNCNPIDEHCSKQTLNPHESRRDQTKLFLRLVGRGHF